RVLPPCPPPVDMRKTAPSPYSPQAQHKVFFAVHDRDRREFDPTPVTKKDRDKVDDYLRNDLAQDKVDRALTLTYATDPDQVVTELVEKANTQELWWWCLLAVIVRVLDEVWLTRRIARQR